VTSTADTDSSQKTVRVAVAVPLDRTFDYNYEGPVVDGPVADGPGPLPRGTIVSVPFGPRELNGIVLGPGDGTVPATTLKPIMAVAPLPPLPAAFVDFLERVASWTMAPIGGVVKMALSQPQALLPPPQRRVYCRPAMPPADERLTDARRRVVAVLEMAGALSAADLQREAGVSASVITAMAKAGSLELLLVSDSEPPPRPRPLSAPPPTADQAAAMRDITTKLAAGFTPLLLDGVTGSGKTEVYFDAVEKVVAAGRQALILLPEIALSAAWKQRFADRFGVPPTEWHSDIAPGRKRRAWRHIALGEASVVVGARSALFLPFSDLGLIVVDEEHEHAYKQEDQVTYHARDMAVLRARLQNCPVILATATPSLESWANAGMVGDPPRYHHISLPHRVGDAQLPEIAAVDLRRTPPERGRWLAPPLVEAITARLEAGEQSLLFLNRRGYAPLTLCGACGHKVTCPNCDSWMVIHRLAGRLKCHHCGYEAQPRRGCVECGEEDSMQACGPGVERLAEEVLQRFPEARFAVFSSDTITTPGSAESFVRSVVDGEVDIIIGTQMAAKGHHFPNLTLVGIVDADLGLAGGDLRAAERSFQMLAQVAGRAGRASRPGVAMLQTMDSTNPVMEALLSGDRDKFLKAESESRRHAGMPPFARLASLVLSAPDPQRLQAAMQMLESSRPHYHGVDIFGPSLAPLGFLRGRHRGRALVRADKAVDIQAVIAAWLAAISLPSGVRLQVDIDPYSFV
jgi:primosomal protein N' (replication factor Y)